jgi:radical SAM-linked protein
MLPSPPILADTPEVPAPQTPGAAQVFRVRLRFEKSELIRWLSHHDLIRAVDRLLRRLGLPVLQSQGFHPQPNIVFALSLPLGAIGREEILEIDLAQGDWNLPELLATLNGGTPPGLKFLNIQAIGPKDRARVESLAYRTTVPDFLLSQTKTGIAHLIGSEKLWVKRQDPAATPLAEVEPNSPFAKDLRSSLKSLELDRDQLEITLIPQPVGTLKPLEILAMLDWPLSSKDFPAPKWERTRLNIAGDDAQERSRTS